MKNAARQNNPLNVLFMTRILTTAFIMGILCMFTPALFSQISLDYYLPQGITYDPAVPKPSEILDYEVGEWHVSHDQLVYYMREMDRLSNRISLEVIGRTYENRPLLHLVITSPENHRNLEEIRQKHIALTWPDKAGNLDIRQMPVVVHMGYSIHGNEASGSNAALLVVYFLAAAQGEWIDRLLKNEIIIIDPSFNPDGMNRFASWVNTHRGINVLNADANSREHNEAWPRGRTNHYWFDLNRDWLPVQLPESRARLEKYHQWKYNYLTDHHEMGSSSTFFFQPGIPSRTHPLTPEGAVSLTYKMSPYYSAALDSIGSLYFTEEDYDDFFYGKGSTYPEINGGVGILFEQASSRGFIQETENGLLTFPFTIKNQFTTSLATLKGTLALRTELLEYQRDFYQKALTEAETDPVKAYVFSAGKDFSRARELAEIALRHEVEVFRLVKPLDISGNLFTPENSYIIPLKQRQYRLIQAMFEKRTTFEDSLFYDISAWTFPLAFAVQYEGLDKKTFQAELLGARVSFENPRGSVNGGKSDYAYAFEWFDYYSPIALNQLMNKGIRVKVATQPFGIKEGPRFDYGSILIPVQGQELNPEELYQVVKEIAEAENGPTVFSLSSGMTTGVRLGSETFKTLEKPRIALAVDGNVNSYEAGQAWHLLDARYGMDVTLLPESRITSGDLDEYNTLILVHGNYGFSAGDRLRLWLEKGGVIVADKGAVRWLSQQGFSQIKMKTTPENSRDTLFAYEDRTNIEEAQSINGAICQTKVDLSHPLGFGLGQETLPVFRNARIFMEKSENPWANPVMYSDKPLMSGYLSDENVEVLRNTAAVTVVKAGKGRIIALADDPNFRAFWYGTNKIFMNAIYFGRIVE
ncbi:MAG: M14 family zinc carboxypeptidase [Bacteroidia bacterium]|nr:M14 family zinc carboxypeptidase [Bacteroidia bacterium]